MAATFGQFPANFRFPGALVGMSGHLPHEHKTALTKVKIGK